MMPPFVVFPTNRIAHFVEVSLYLFYLAQQVKLFLLLCMKETVTIVLLITRACPQKGLLQIVMCRRRECFFKHALGSSHIIL